MFATSFAAAAQGTYYTDKPAAAANNSQHAGSTLTASQHHSRIASALLECDHNVTRAYRARGSNQNSLAIVKSSACVRDHNINACARQHQLIRLKARTVSIDGCSYAASMNRNTSQAGTKVVVVFRIQKRVLCPFFAMTSAQRAGIE